MGKSRAKLKKRDNKRRAQRMQYRAPRKASTASLVVRVNSTLPPKQTGPSARNHDRRKRRNTSTTANANCSGTSANPAQNEDTAGVHRNESTAAAAPSSMESVPQSASSAAASYVTTSTPLLRILVVGDGDFSYSLALWLQLRKQQERATAQSLLEREEASAKPSIKLLATVYDSQSVCHAKYPKTAMANAQALRQRGVDVRFNVDATALDSVLAPCQKFERIMFNFPHSGQQRVHINRALLRDFFASAAPFLRQGAGEIHVVLKDKPPYSNFRIVDMAREGGALACVRRIPFIAPHGYRHKTTLADAKRFDARFCYVYCFVARS